MAKNNLILILAALHEDVLALHKRPNKLSKCSEFYVLLGGRLKLCDYDRLSSVNNAMLCRYCPLNAISARIGIWGIIL